MSAPFSCLFSNSISVKSILQQLWQNTWLMTIPLYTLSKKTSQFIQTRNTSFLRNGTASLCHTIYTHWYSRLNKQSNFCSGSLSFTSFQLINQFMNYGGKCWTCLFKHCNKDGVTRRSGINIIQYLSASFAGMVDD